MDIRHLDDLIDGARILGGGRMDSVLGRMGVGDLGVGGWILLGAAMVDAGDVGLSGGPCRWSSPDGEPSCITGQHGA